MLFRSLSTTKDLSKEDSYAIAGKAVEAMLEVPMLTVLQKRYFRIVAIKIAENIIFTLFFA